MNGKSILGETDATIVEFLDGNLSVQYLQVLIMLLDGEGVTSVFSHFSSTGKREFLKRASFTYI